MRKRIEAELQNHDITPEVVDRLVLATAEACNNAITHSDCSSYVVTLDLEDTVCTITVSDAGAGFEVPERFEMPEPHEVSRRGLALMNALVDDVGVTSNGSGTQVVLRQALTQVARTVALT